MSMPRLAIHQTRFPVARGSIGNTTPTRRVDVRVNGGNMPIDAAKRMVHLIRNRSTALGYCEALPDERLRHFVLGFKSAVIARHVMYTMDEKPSIRLYRSGGERTIAGPVDICIDPAARVHIPKVLVRGIVSAPPRGTEHLETNVNHLYSVNLDSFLRFPVENNIGIIMPYEVVKEDEDEIVLAAQTVSVDLIDMLDGNEKLLEQLRNQLRL